MKTLIFGSFGAFRNAGFWGILPENDSLRAIVHSVTNL